MSELERDSVASWRKELWTIVLKETDLGQAESNLDL